MRIHFLSTLCFVSMTNFVALSNFCSDTAFAATVKAKSTQVLFNEVDISPLVQAFQKITGTLEKPAKVYHWKDGKDESEWAGALSATSPQGLSYAQKIAAVYWQKYLTLSPTNMFGFGLYMALDPVKTQEYGGDNWVLLQIELKKGFRYLDLTLPEAQQKISAKVKSVLDQFQCGEVPNLADLLKAGHPRSVNAGLTCQQMLEEVLKNQIHMAGFFYTYNSAYFLSCSNEDGQRKKALVLTDEAQVDEGSIRIFNSQTTDAPEERIKIQSLFYKASDDATTSPAAQKNIPFVRDGNDLRQELRKKIPELYPHYTILSMSGACANGGCSYLMKICKTGDDGTLAEDQSHNWICQDNVDVPVMKRQPYPALISAENVPVANDKNIHGLLWEDLDGQKTDPKINAWIKKNLIGCDQ
jgi:hypothetical protein